MYSIQRLVNYLLSGVKLVNLLNRYSEISDRSRPTAEIVCSRRI